MTNEQILDIIHDSRGVTTDTRQLSDGMVFFALRGVSFNGNEFAQQALHSGCKYAIIDDPQYAIDNRYIVVDNVLTTLQQVSALHRQQLAHNGLRVLQITGTNGKTTTKELCATVLSRKYNVLYTQGNLNNHIGVPLTLLRLRPEHQVAVIETGANHPGEIATLTHIVQPDFGLITNVGRAHLEGFGGFEGVKRTKGELYDWLAAHRRPAFVNTADHDLSQMAHDRTLQYYPYVTGQVIPSDGLLQALITLPNSPSPQTLTTHLVGAYNLPNVLAAITVGRYFEVDERDIYDAISNYQPTNNRSQLVKTPRNTLIVDAYNANPSSMALAIQNFASIPAPRKMMILGDMRELGSASLDEHRAILNAALSTPSEAIWLVGSEFAQAYQTLNATTSEANQLIGSESAQAYQTLNVTTSRVRLFADVEAVKQALLPPNQSESTHNLLQSDHNTTPQHQIEGYTILIKGSNGTHLYQLPPLL